MRARRAVLLLALLACVHAASFLGSGPCDDDFIVYRYARNWVEGQGLVFNPGEHFEGYSAPLWVFWIAAALRLRIDPVVASVATGVAAAGVAVGALAETWRRRFPSSTLAPPALLLALTPVLAWHAVAGLGTTALAALLALWWLSYEGAVRADRPARGASLALALACLLRQECVLFALPFTVAELRRRRDPALALPWLAFGGWTVFRLVHYGRWLPITYTVKKLPVPTDLAYGARYLWDATLACGFGAFLVAAVLAAARARGPLRTPVRVAATGLVVHALYVVWVGGDFVALARFFVPTLPIAFGLGWLGVHELLADRRALRVGLCALAAIALQWPQLERPQLFGEHRFFEERWARIGRHLGATVDPATTVAISPIGAFGWTSRLPVVDVLGLTHDAALDEAPDLAIRMKGHHRFDGGWVLDQRPELVILGNGVRQPGTDRLVVNPWERTILEDPRFPREYTRVAVPLPDDPVPVDVFVRVGAPLPPGARVMEGAPR